MKGYEKRKTNKLKYGYARWVKAKITIRNEENKDYLTPVCNNEIYNSFISIQCQSFSPDTHSGHKGSPSGGMKALILNFCCLSVLSKTEKPIEDTPNRKSGVELRRRSSGNTENLPSTPALNVIASISLNLSIWQRAGSCGLGTAQPQKTIAQIFILESSH